MRKLSLDLFEEVDYKLIGIHTSIEDYRLAYLLNEKLGLKLKRNKQDLDFDNNSQYAIFEWFDEKKQVVWNLAANICKQEVRLDTSETNGLFFEGKTMLTTFYLLPEHKKINFLLKIEDGNTKPTETKRLLNRIQEINHIVTAYSIDANQLKSKNNLIFY